MKRRLNILCLVVMLVLSYSVLEQGYYIFLGAKMGAQTGLELESFFDVKSVDGPAESICEGTASFQGGVWGGCQYRIFRDFQPLGLQFRPETYFCRK